MRTVVYLDMHVLAVRGVPDQYSSSSTVNIGSLHALCQHVCLQLGNS